jgi:TolA-binding protein
MSNRVVTVLVGMAMLNMLGFAEPVVAQPTTRSVETLETENNVMKADLQILKERMERLQKQNDDLGRRVEEIQAPLYKKYIETKQREYEFAANMMDVNIHNFQHQRTASYVILVMVICVVLSGLRFSYVQLVAGLDSRSLSRWKPNIPGAALSSKPADGTARAAEEGGEAPHGTNEPMEPSPARPCSEGVTTIDASFTKVTITSSVVGVIVLVISLAFLYLYIREVYTIKIIDPYRPTIASPPGPG